MAEFQRRPLGVLDRIYGFVGGLRGVSQVELATPIQLVHDVSQEGERAAARGRAANDAAGVGYIVVEQVHAHAGAGTLYGSTSLPALAGSPYFLDMSQTDIWLYGIGAQMSAAGLVNKFVAAMEVLLPGNSVAIPYVLLSATGGTGVTALTSAIDNVTTFPTPIRLPGGASLVTRSTATAAVDVTWSFILTATPRGARP